MHFFSLSLSVGSLAAILSLPTPTASPLPVAECRRRIDHAYEQFEQLQRVQQKGILELHFTSGTTYRPPGAKKLATTTAHFTLLSKPNHTYLSDGEVDLYQDGEVQVSVMHSQRTILITAKQAQTANSLNQLLKMHDQLKTQTTITKASLEESKGGGGARYFIETRPAPGSAIAGKLASICYWLDPHTDVLRQIVMYYPTGYGLHSASLVLETQRIKAQDPAVDQPALGQVFGRDNKLLPVYRSFKVQDLRRS